MLVILPGSLRCLLLLFFLGFARAALTVSSPAGGSTLMIGQVTDIKWTGGDAPNLSLYITTPHIKRVDENYYLLASGISNTQGKSFQWTVPNVGSGSFQLEFRGNNGVIEGASGIFNIVPGRAADMGPRVAWNQGAADTVTTNATNPMPQTTAVVANPSPQATSAPSMTTAVTLLMTRSSTAVFTTPLTIVSGSVTSVVLDTFSSVLVTTFSSVLSTVVPDSSLSGGFVTTVITRTLDDGSVVTASVVLPRKPSSNLPPGTLAAITVGAVLGVVMILLFVYCILRYRRRKQLPTKPAPIPYPPPVPPQPEPNNPSIYEPSVRTVFTTSTASKRTSQSQNGDGPLSPSSRRSVAHSVVDPRYPSPMSRHSSLQPGQQRHSSMNEVSNAMHRRSFQPVPPSNGLFPSATSSPSASFAVQPVRNSIAEQDSLYGGGASRYHPITSQQHLPGITPNSPQNSERGLYDAVHGTTLSRNQSIVSYQGAQTPNQEHAIPLSRNQSPQVSHASPHQMGSPSIARNSVSKGENQGLSQVTYPPPIKEELSGHQRLSSMNGFEGSDDGN